ncbi:DUF7019 family protein [Pseudarthrobacter sp. AB1]|uniref:DUF7019 family protein n=1 Tax=Pseudarthrobacter sp. AB1 TaxID=2138309 RepID=UPI00186B9A31|nr:hypothetical protein [Pseudarthrobacter sp. AB1]MBE4720473.1 hypothetical protein [Pseudarthrobacter sp. AB1]
MNRREHLGAYHYISNRLVSELLSMPEVPRPRRKPQIQEISPELSLEGPKLGAKVSFAKYEETLHDRAGRATRFLQSGHQIGDLSEPQMPYLRVRLDAYMATFNVVQGWDWDGVPTDGYAQNVMLLASSQVVAGKRVFVGLIGSAHNMLTSGLTNPVSYTQGRTPSDIDGFYALFNQIREREDARVHNSRVNDDHRMTDLEVARHVMALAQGSPGDGPPRRVEVLLKLHRPPLSGHVILDNQFLAPYNLVILGAPLWIREVATSDGSPAVPLMDAVGPSGHAVFSAGRRELVELAQAAVAKNVALNAFQDQFEELGGPRIADNEPSVLARKRSLAADIIELFEARDTACTVYAEHEAAFLTSAKDFSNWSTFAEWFTTQACLDGVPLAYLCVERKPSWWRRFWHRDQATRAPEQTSIAGVVVTIFSESDPSIRDNLLPLGTFRDAQNRDHRYPGNRGRAEHALLTPSGEIYPVTISSFRHSDPHARVVFLRPRSENNQLGQYEVPSSDPGLVEHAARAMLEAAMRWRITLRRAVPEAPWLHDETPLALVPRTPREAPAAATISSIEAILRDAESVEGDAQSLVDDA